MGRDFLVKAEVRVNEEAKVASIRDRCEENVLVNGERRLVKLCKLLRKTDDQKFCFRWV
jgi:hypothetical protein